MRRKIAAGVLFALTAFYLVVTPGTAFAASAQKLSPSALAFPAAFTLTPDGSRILYGERFTGRISWLNPATGTSTPFFTVPNVATAGEHGLLGLALSPSYPSDARVWAFVTRTVSGTAAEPALCGSAPTAAASRSCAASRPPCTTTAAGSCSAPTASSTWSSGTTTARPSPRTWPSWPGRCCG